MINVLIHACPDRMWYVNNHLIPRLNELSLELLSIKVYCDYEHHGNQKAFLESLNMLPTNGNTWHMQDDVWPSDDLFKQMTILNSVNGIICGFGTRPSCRGKSPGWTTPAGMYYSFQCIRIPNEMMTLFKDYVIRKYTHDPSLKTDKWDDALFNEFLLRKAPYYPVLNLAPSIVEHIDYLIGGSVINKDRKYRPCAIEFDEKSIKRLYERLGIKDE